MDLSGQNGPKWTILVRFGLPNAKIRFGIRSKWPKMVVWTILGHFGPVYFPTVLWPLPRYSRLVVKLFSATAHPRTHPPTPPISSGFRVVFEPTLSRDRQSTRKRRWARGWAVAEKQFHYSRVSICKALRCKLSSPVIFFSLTEAPLPDPTQHTETDPKQTWNGPKRRPEGLSGWGL